jgi:hypothetical protein
VTLTLRAAGFVFLGGLVLHNGDHMRRGLTGIPEGVTWAGTLVLALAAVTLTLVFTHHDLAPLASTVTGFATSAGVTASHLLPHWGPLSNPLAGSGVGAATWMAVLAEVAGAIVLGGAGLAVLRRHSFAARVPAWR